MKQIVNTRNGSYDVLKVQDVPDLSPGANELLIEVKASGLNFADILARKGQYPDGPDKPCVMGYEVAGIVAEAGEKVSGVYGVYGVNLGHLWHEGDKASLWMKEILNGAEEGWVNPHVDTTFSFADAGKAHRYIEERKNIGKVILVP